MMIARYGTAHHVERLVRNYRKVKRIEALDQENTRHAQRELSWYVDDEGYWVLRGRFTAEQGALIQNSLEQAMEEDFQEQKNVAAETFFPCSPPTNNRAFISPRIPPFRTGLAREWMINWRFWG